MKEFERLKQIVEKLRSPQGCPWDKEQTLYSMKTDMIEEAFELLDALDNKDIDNIKEELGDLLLHVVMHSQIAQEENLFSITDVITNLNEKLIRRHPHVFSGVDLKNTDEVLKKWDEIKAKEKTGKPTYQSVLDSIPSNIPSIIKAEKIQKKAAKFGFDWTDIKDVLNKLDEEISELKEAVSSGNKEKVCNELGDVIFAAVNVARHMGVDADESLRNTNKKFRNRFFHIEKTLEAKGKKLKDTTLDEMEAIWQEAKKIQ